MRKPIHLQRLMRRLPLLILAMSLSGCVHLPKSKQPVIVEASMPASPDQTWDAVHQVISLYRGRIIVEDRASGLIVFVTNTVWKGHPVYVNVTVRGSEEGAQTEVRFFPQVRDGRYVGEMDGDFFAALRSRLEGE